MPTPPNIFMANENEPFVEDKNERSSNATSLSENCVLHSECSARNRTNVTDVFEDSLIYMLTSELVAKTVNTTITNYP